MSAKKKGRGQEGAQVKLLDHQTSLREVSPINYSPPLEHMTSAEAAAAMNKDTGFAQTRRRRSHAVSGYDPTTMLLCDARRRDHPPRRDTTDVQLQLRALPLRSLFIVPQSVKSVTCNAWYLHSIRSLTKALYQALFYQQEASTLRLQKQDLISRFTRPRYRSLSIELSLFSRPYLTYSYSS